MDTIQNSVDNLRNDIVRYAEFCTGSSGFRLGIEASSLNAELVYTNEINTACAKTYMKNFGRDFDSTDLLSLEIVIYQSLICYMSASHANLFQ